MTGNFDSAGLRFIGQWRWFLRGDGFFANVRVLSDWSIICVALGFAPLLW
jgi:hypothetical protein